VVVHVGGWKIRKSYERAKKGSEGVVARGLCEPWTPPPRGESGFTSDKSKGEDRAGGLPLLLSATRFLPKRLLVVVPQLQIIRPRNDDEEAEIGERNGFASGEIRKVRARGTSD